MVSNALMSVEGAPRVAPTLGLFSVLAPRAEASGHWSNGVSWESLSCSPASGIGDPDCETPEETVGLPKGDAEGAANGTASPFTVYFKEVCSPVGRVQAAQDRATSSLLVKEQERVERALWTGDLGNTPNLQAVESIGNSSEPAYVLGALTKQARRAFGMGVLHVGTIGAAVLFDHDLLVMRGEAVFTVFGDQVVIGAGYLEEDGGPLLGAADPGNVWAVMSPPLFGYRSDVFTSSERTGDLLDRGTNNFYAVAERTYVVGFDPCPVAAAQMTAYEVTP